MCFCKQGRKKRLLYIKWIIERMSLKWEWIIYFTFFLLALVSIFFSLFYQNTLLASRFQFVHECVEGQDVFQLCGNLRLATHVKWITKRCILELLWWYWCGCFVNLQRALIERAVMYGISCVLRPKMGVLRNCVSDSLLMSGLNHSSPRSEGWLRLENLKFHEIRIQGAKEYPETKSRRRLSQQNSFIRSSVRPVCTTGRVQWFEMWFVKGTG